jgi:hypothetical protein
MANQNESGAAKSSRTLHRVSQQPAGKKEMLNNFIVTCDMEC